MILLRLGIQVQEKCEKCGHIGLSYKTMQLRSADEGATVFYKVSPFAPPTGAMPGRGVSLDGPRGIIETCLEVLITTRRSSSPVLVFELWRPDSIKQLKEGHRGTNLLQNRASILFLQRSSRHCGAAPLSLHLHTITRLVDGPRIDSSFVPWILCHYYCIICLWTVISPVDCVGDGCVLWLCDDGVCVC